MLQRWNVIQTLLALVRILDSRQNEPQYDEYPKTHNFPRFNGYNIEKTTQRYGFS